MTEVDEKIDRVVRFAHKHGLAGVLLSRQSNFAWLTGGQSNRIDGSTDVGSGSLLITANGDRYVIANNIEMPRLCDEALYRLGFSPVEYAWQRDHAETGAPLKVAQQIVRDNVGADAPAEGATDVSALVTALQTPLTDPELARYRSLGRDVASALEQLCRTLKPWLSESVVAHRVNSTMALLGARAIVTLVAGDERIARLRHPVPTPRRWSHSLLIGVCAERHGLVVALSRLISTRAASLQHITTAAATVFGTMLMATQPGVTGAQLFTTAANAYRNAGYQGEEARHHQGGAIGYKSRDWIAHAASADVVQDRQAFAWNPSITGTKVEDTAVLVDGHLELLTSTGDWPTIDVAIGDKHVRAPGILEA
jgi:Xaa-Pro aminopeptidase